MKLTARRATAIGVIAAAVIVGTPLAAQALDPAIPSYAGCLNTAKGTVAAVKEGTEPLRACVSGETKISMAGGDITSVVAGTGLTGGATTGGAQLSLTPNYQLPQGCATGKTPKRSTTGWFCGTDYGSFTSIVSPAFDVTATQGGDCLGDSILPDYALPNTADNSTKATPVSLPTGTYRPYFAGDFRWIIKRNKDLQVADTYANGDVKVELVRVRSGVETVVSQWARSVSQDMNDGWQRELTSFVALSGDTYYVRGHAAAMPCTTSSVLGVQVGFDQVG